MDYTRNELRVLWYIKKRNPLLSKSFNVKDSLIVEIATDQDLRKNTVSAILKHLEVNCIIVRTYKRPITAEFAGKVGYNPLIKIELIDPDMYLPPLPAPLPLAAVVAKENEDLYERTNHEPSVEAIVEALLNRVIVLQGQVDKLQGIVESQAAELIKRKERPVREHLTSRIKDILPPEDWEKITHGK